MIKYSNTLDAIETASVEELRELQFRRMKWTLEHAYKNSPMYTKSLMKQGCIHQTLNVSKTLISFLTPPSRT